MIITKGTIKCNCLFCRFRNEKISKKRFFILLDEWFEKEYKNEKKSLKEK